MKAALFSIGFLCVIASASSCSNQKTAAETSQTSEQQELEVTGEIVKIENGKDGYMATVKDSDQKNYVVTISSVNLQKSGGTYQQFQVGERIWTKGTFWKDDAGQIYITAKAVKRVN